MLDALIEGTTDPAALADLAQRRLRSKIPVLTEALTGRFTPHHGHLIRMYLELIDSYAAALSDLDARIVDALSPSLAAARDLLCSIPGWSTRVAEVFLAETGGDMRAFPPRATSPPGPGSAPVPTNPPAGSSPPRPATATATSKVLSASRRCRRHDLGTPTSPPSTAASAHIEDR
jgi:transposase